jgi:hypothetical protein
MKTLLVVSLVAIVASVPATLHAQSSKPQPSAALGKKTLVKDGKSAPRQILFRHPNAAQRGLRPSDLVLVKTPSGEQKYARKKSQLRHEKTAVPAR